MIGRETVTVPRETNRLGAVLDTALQHEVWNGAAVLSAADEQILSGC